MYAKHITYDEHSTNGRDCRPGEVRARSLLGAREAERESEEEKEARADEDFAERAERDKWRWYEMTR